MQSFEILDHKVGNKANVVTKFNVRETITKDKLMTFNELSKQSEGVAAYDAYVKEQKKENGVDITSVKNFKLCSKAKKDTEKCKAATGRKRTQKRKVVAKTKVPKSPTSFTHTKTKSNKRVKAQKSKSISAAQSGFANNASFYSARNSIASTRESRSKSTTADRRVTISPRGLEALKRLIASSSSASKRSTKSSHDSPLITMSDADSKGRRKTISARDLAALKEMIGLEKSKTKSNSNKTTKKTTKKVKKAAAPVARRSPRPQRKTRLNPKYFGNEWTK